MDPLVEDHFGLNENEDIFCNDYHAIVELPSILPGFFMNKVKKEMDQGKTKLYNSTMDQWGHYNGPDMQQYLNIMPNIGGLNLFCKKNNAMITNRFNKAVNKPLVSAYLKAKPKSASATRDYLLLTRSGTATMSKISGKYYLSYDVKVNGALLADMCWGGNLPGIPFYVADRSIKGNMTVCEALMGSTTCAITSIYRDTAGGRVKKVADECKNLILGMAPGHSMYKLFYDACKQGPSSNIFPGTDYCRKLGGGSWGGDIIDPEDVLPASTQDRISPLAGSFKYAQGIVDAAKKDTRASMDKTNSERDLKTRAKNYKTIFEIMKLAYGKAEEIMDDASKLEGVNDKDEKDLAEQKQAWATELAVYADKYEDSAKALESSDSGPGNTYRDRVSPLEAPLKRAKDTLESAWVEVEGAVYKSKMASDTKSKIKYYEQIIKLVEDAFEKANKLMDGVKNDKRMNENDHEAMAKQRQEWEKQLNSFVSMYVSLIDSVKGGGAVYYSDTKPTIEDELVRARRLFNELKQEAETEAKNASRQTNMELQFQDLKAAYTAIRDSYNKASNIVDDALWRSATSKSERNDVAAQKKIWMNEVNKYKAEYEDVKRIVEGTRWAANNLDWRKNFEKKAEEAAKKRAQEKRETEKREMEQKNDKVDISVKKTQDDKKKDKEYKIILIVIILVIIFAFTFTIIRWIYEAKKGRGYVSI